MKKCVSLFLTLAMVLSMCSFAGASSLEGTYDVTLWVGEKAVELTQKQVADFNASNTLGITINATVEAVSEADSATQMVTDVEAGADLYCFAQDQFARLVQAGALMQLGAGASEFVRTNNDAGTVAAATSGDAVYAYPLTADNGYFMYYDKSVIPEEDVDSLEKLIADCEAAGKNFSFEMQTSAWYLASFFFGTGCVSDWVTDDEGKFISVHDTFNSPEGLIAVKGMKKLVDSPIHVSSSSGSDFASNSAIVVSGTWDYDTVSKILGDNFGVADLPSFEVDGTEYHLGSFNGCKLMGVKPQVDAVKGAVLNQLAQYLTGEQGQMERFETLGWGPSNLADQASEAVQNNATLAALIAQNAYSVPQGQIHGSWWDLAKVIGDDVKKATDEAGLQTALDNYQEKMAALFTMSDDEMNGWTVIGSINGDGWTVDLPMEKGEDGVWKTTEAYAMDAGVEFKVRQGKSWDNNFPAENFVVETAGTYYVTFDEAAQTVALAAE
ncbi:MAG: extracellular solute-binding protein [Clostridia bacterium]|nr:extracellular solute-binding protein [Clostridia bacterium]